MEVVLVCEFISWCDNALVSEAGVVNALQLISILEPAKVKVPELLLQ